MSREEMKKVRLNYEKRKNRTNHSLVEGMIMKMRPTGWCQTSEAMGVRARGGVTQSSALLALPPPLVTSANRPQVLHRLSRGPSPP